MVEMTETANILQNATRNSLVLLDEIGRGTSTFDGLSLAWASATELADRIHALTLFATHYFELTRLADEQATIRNVHFDAIQTDSPGGPGLVFQHQVKQGAINDSYGLQVAALAGVPGPVIDNARRKLQQLESDRIGETPAEPVDPGQAENPAADSKFSESVNELVRQLSDIDLDEMTPKQAHSLLYRLRSKLDK